MTDVTTFQNCVDLAVQAVVYGFVAGAVVGILFGVLGRASRG